VDLKTVFENYNAAFLQDLMTVLKGLKGSNKSISVDEIIAYGNGDAMEKKLSGYEINKEREQARREFKHNTKRCAECGSIMVLHSVNDAPGNQVGEGFKSVWSCVDVMGCGETIYSTNSVNDEAERFGIGKFYPKETPVKISPEERRRRKASMRRGAVVIPDRPVS